MIQRIFRSMIHGYLFYYFLIIRKEASFIGKKFENSTFFVRSIFQDLEFDLGKKRKETKGKFLAQTEQLNPYERFTIKKKKKRTIYIHTRKFRFQFEYTWIELSARKHQSFPSAIRNRNTSSFDERGATTRASTNSRERQSTFRYEREREEVKEDQLNRQLLLLSDHCSTIRAHFISR